MLGIFPKSWDKNPTQNLFFLHYKLIFIALEPMELCQYGTTVCSILGISHSSQMFWWFDFQRENRCYQLELPLAASLPALSKPWLPLGSKSQLTFTGLLRIFVIQTQWTPRCTRVLLWGRFWLILHQLRYKSELSAGWPTAQSPLTWKIEFRSLWGFSGSWSFINLLPPSKCAKQFA